MSISTKVWKALGVGLAVAILVFVVVRTWLVPVLIVNAIQGQLEGKVTIRSWWLNSRSAGVVGLTIREKPAADSAMLASAQRVATDLSIGRLLRGRWMPGRIALERPVVKLRVDRTGRILNLPTLKEGREPARLPAVSVDAARVIFHGEGKTEAMVVSGVTARLQPDSSGRTLTISGGTDDPTWGRWSASGLIAPGDRGGELRLNGSRVEADPKTLARVPFIPSEIWSHVVSRGPVNVEVRLDWSTGRTPDFRATTEVTLLGTSVRFPTLDLAAESTTGTLRVEGGLVRVAGVRGRAIGGQVDGGGTLDFGRSPPRIDLDLALKQIKVEDTPKLWQLDKLDITGRLTGMVALRALLRPSGVDLSGTTGEAVVEDASIQGFKFKSLTLAMQAQGDELEYDTRTPGETRAGRVLETLAAWIPARHAFGPTVAAALVALQAPTNPEKPAAQPANEGRVKDEEPGKFAVRLPKTISTQIELEDVDVAQLIAKAQFLAAFPFPIPVTGRLSLKAKATLPLGAMSDIKQYVFHGEATLKGASVFKVDFSLLRARLDLEDGILDLKELRGMLVDRPNGGPDNPPRITEPVVPAEGPLPPGGFRGDLRAEIAPPGRFRARFEGNQLPLGELSAPMLPRPTPLAGLASMKVEAQADLARATDPAAWTASGRAESVQVTYRNAVLERITLEFDLKEGRLALPSLKAQMAGRPLTVKGELELKPPLAYQATLNVEDWDLATIVALVPNTPQPSPVAGSLSARAEARGTLSPWTITTDGRGRIARFVAGPVPLGEVPFRWSTDRDSILISDVEARPFGGQLSAEAHIPVAGGGAAEGTATLRAIDTARLSAALPGQDLKLTGTAEGTMAFVIPKEFRTRGLEANVRISSRDLTFQGIPAEQVRASIRARQGVLRYEVTADSLGGKLKVLGDFPLTSTQPPADQAKVADGEVRLLDFALDQVWKALKIANTASLLSGQGAIVANVRNVLADAGKGLWLHGIVELRNLRWDRGERVGQLRGIVAKTPTTWRIEPLSGELMGGATNGALWGTTPSQGTPEVGFTLRVERATLKRMLMFAPSLARYATGTGSLQVTGRLDEVLRANAGLQIAQARFAGLPIDELQAPVDLVFTPSTGAGTVQLRRASARVSGGHVRGDASFRIGENRSFQGEIQLNGIDLHTLNRLGSDSNRLATGRISGRISLSGPDPNFPERVRGRVNLDLDDAALFSIPIFREVEKFFGSARGGLFEDGDLVGVIANRQLIIETLSLEGRIVQMHVTGTVGFDSQLNLVVLVNTSQLIPETGQALLARIPGLSDVLGRSEEVVARVSTFLSNRLLKLRVTGTLRNPSVSVDASVLVAETAVAFFAGVLKLPLGFLR